MKVWVKVSATIDKADHAVQMYKVTKKDLSCIEPLIKNRSDKDIPNFMHVIYKNRSGENNIIIWSQMNHGNMRERVIFVTDMNYKLIDIRPVNIVFK